MPKATCKSDQKQVSFMLKEIFEQPASIKSALAGRIVPVKFKVKLTELNKIAKQLKQIKQIVILGCGSSWHAGLIGELLIEELAKIPVEVEYASEFCNRQPASRLRDRPCNPSAVGTRSYAVRNGGRPGSCFSFS